MDNNNAYISKGKLYVNNIAVSSYPLEKVTTQPDTGNASSGGDDKISSSEPL